MKQLLLMAQYNLWADMVICKRIDQLKDDLLDKEVKSSFSSIRKTLGHMFDAERIWLNRLDGRSLEHWPSQQIENFTTAHLLEESKAVLKYVETLNEQVINSLCTYQTRDGKSQTNGVGEIVLHLINHETYHRGQLITLMRELGVDQIPATDLIVYLRSERV